MQLAKEFIVNLFQKVSVIIMRTNFLPACELIILVNTLLIINIVGSPMKSTDIYKENRVVIPLNA